MAEAEAEAEAKAVLIRDPESPKSTSKNVIVKGTHSLEIQGFSFTKGMGSGNCISSDTFLVGGHSWEIRFYPGSYRRVDESGEVYVSLYIALVSKCEGRVEAYFEYVLLDPSGNKWCKSNGRFKRIETGPGLWLSGPHTVKESSLWGRPHFYKRTELEASQYIKDDCLTIQCTLGVVKKSFAQPLPLSDLGKSYEQLLKSKEGSDISFEVEGETFYAHKPILSTRSPVFKAQFFGPLKEENTALIKIEEMQAPVFKFFSSAVMQTDRFKNLKESCHTVINDLLKSLARVRDYTYVSYELGNSDANGKRVKL
ncbi:hypothetical protein RD792_002019 [Penstemon davidsonii]|uniref:Uncharacterized protein n=1 Tax=Penstemon davidsonii TaxID=160366 RepID=A0ABR0DPX1_9LAMI|nr:hypothetical protein RD792_002019 [Penstemon davidsonii]